MGPEDKEGNYNTRRNPLLYNASHAVFLPTKGKHHIPRCKSLPQNGDFLKVLLRGGRRTGREEIKHQHHHVV